MGWVGFRTDLHRNDPGGPSSTNGIFGRFFSTGFGGWFQYNMCFIAVGYGLIFCTAGLEFGGLVGLRPVPSDPTRGSIAGNRINPPSFDQG